MKLLVLKSRIWELLREVEENLNKLFSPALEEMGLTMLQMQLLIRVQKEAGMTVGNLARSLGLAATNASALCKKLEIEGLISRQRSSQDERVVTLSLAPEGQKLLQEVNNKICAQSRSACLGRETPESLSEIERGLEQLNNLLLQLREEAVPPAEPSEYSGKDLKMDVKRSGE